MFIYKEDRETYIGRRLRCLVMENDPDPIPSGTEGTIDYIDDAGMIHMKWDNGRTLALDPTDIFELIDPKCTNPLYRECAVFYHNHCKGCPMFK